MRATAVCIIIAIALWDSRCRSGERPTPPRGVSYSNPPVPATSPADPPGVAGSHPAQSGRADAPTPMAEVVRVLSLLPEPQVGYADLGCGDGRWLFAAAERWPKASVVGVEIDAGRAAATREQVRLAGLSSRITIIEGDATLVEWKADVATAYLYGDVLDRLRPRVDKLRAFASYMHRPAGLPVVQNGNSWIYTRPVQQVAASRPTAIWNGVAYSGPVCNNPNCGMCLSIRSQLSVSPVETVHATQPTTAASGKWVRTKVCNGKACWFVDTWVPGY